MKKYLIVAGRIAAVLVGIPFLFVQLSNFSHLVVPSNGEAIGYDAIWLIITAVSLKLILWGGGIRLVRRRLPNHSGQQH